MKKPLMLVFSAIFLILFSLNLIFASNPFAGNLEFRINLIGLNESNNWIHYETEEGVDVTLLQSDFHSFERLSGQLAT